jgi:hypothetical protein
VEVIGDDLNAFIKTGRESSRPVGQ